MPRIVDIFQTYLREVRTNDLNGSAGLFRLKEELTRRVNLTVAPHQVTRCCSRKSWFSDGTDVTLWPATTRWTRMQLPNSGERRWIRKTRQRPRKEAAANELSGTMALQWAAMVEDGSRNFATRQELRRAGALAGGNRQPARLQPSARSISTTIPASAPSSTRRWCPTNACRCWKSSSTAWCG